MSNVIIDTNQISDWNSFHDIFSKALGFPDYYGRNMNAWIDCMTYLNDHEETDTEICAEKEQMVVLELKGMKGLKKKCPDIYDAIIESSAFVNFRRLEVGVSPVLALSFWATDPRE